MRKLTMIRMEASGLREERTTELGLVRQLGEMANLLKNMRIVLLCSIVVAVVAALVSFAVKVNKTEVIQDTQSDEYFVKDLIQRIEDDADLVCVHGFTDIFKPKENRVSKIKFYNGVLHREGSESGDNVIYIKVYFGFEKDILYTYNLDGNHHNTLRRLYRSSEEAIND